MAPKWSELTMYSTVQSRYEKSEQTKIIKDEACASCATKRRRRWGGELVFKEVSILPTIKMLYFRRGLASNYLKSFSYILLWKKELCPNINAAIPVHFSLLHEIVFLPKIEFLWVLYSNCILMLEKKYVGGNFNFTLQQNQRNDYPRNQVLSQTRVSNKLHFLSRNRQRKCVLSPWLLYCICWWNVNIPMTST